MIPYPPKLLRFPDVHGDRVAFCYAGDLWTAPSTGGTEEATYPGGEEEEPPVEEETTPKKKTDSSGCSMASGSNGTTSALPIAAAMLGLGVARLARRRRKA